MVEDDDLTPNLMSNQVWRGNGEFVPPDGICWVSVLSCLLLACSYVGSLYVWRSDLPRDHPAVIKRRFTSVLIVSAVSPAFVWAWKMYTGVMSGPSLLALMGIRFEGLIPAIILPLLLTMVLFVGPLIQLAMDCPWGFMDGIRVTFDPWFWALCLSDMRWLRNQVVAPLTEELVFRACMLPMLVPCTSPSTAIFTCPLFFGVAHFHHVIELLRFRQGTLSGIFLAAVFQFSYTAVFGAYTAFIFIRTGHLVGPVLCHSFCNHMGFPALGMALEHPHRLTVLSCYLLGVLLFLLLLFPLTDPIFYGLPTPVCTLASVPSSLCVS
ncbi:CAAX prenyl protease 2 [Salmo salar]|uniref:CAAX prenyl protease 2 n=1 Tax=Salmo salar TaxID=8030 RepID=A0A1S3N6M6_SALSA|nr:CAAX prenyl protease 2 [Salmo salar]|eukprot:XP_014011089.1 PREDICTED: CAAX prenyl protease 2-like [Salmo salar]